MFSSEKQLRLILKEISCIASVQNKLTGFCIGNTRKLNNAELYFSPIRNTRQLVAGSVIVYSAEQAATIAQQIDGKVDYVLIDTEKKISSTFGDQCFENPERWIREVVHHSKVLTYKGNDLTVDSIESLIVQILSSYPRGLSGKKAAIIGAGNIGSKLALKLVERGMNVTISRRDKEKLDAIVSAINIIKPFETIAKVFGSQDLLEAAIGVDLLVGLTGGQAMITAAMVEVVAPGAVLIDGGKGCFQKEAIALAESKDIPIYRADIRAGFEGHVATALEMERIVQNTIGRNKISGVNVVSGGLLGRSNEVVVDNLNDPQTIFGIADGLGDFIRNLDVEQKNMVQTIQNYITSRRKT